MVQATSAESALQATTPMMVELVREVNRTFSADGSRCHQPWGVTPGFE
jgi:hypothetical protein